MIETKVIKVDFKTGRQMPGVFLVQFDRSLAPIQGPLAPVVRGRADFLPAPGNFADYTAPHGPSVGVDQAAVSAVRRSLDPATAQKLLERFRLIPNGDSAPLTDQQLAEALRVLRTAS